jgi:cell division protein FtsQ
MRKRFIIGLSLLLLFTTYKPQKLFLGTKFNIKEITIENNFILKDSEIKKILAPIYGKNLFFLKNSNLKKILKANDFIDSFKVKKIYPNKVKIKIFEKKPIAILQYKKEKFFISEKIDLINFVELNEYNNLPIIFGNKENFKDFYFNLKKINFPIESIKTFYLYESNRWDLKTYQNKLIKLPEKNYLKSLENFINSNKKNNFEKYKVFDYRLNGQLILK